MMTLTPEWKPILFPGECASFGTPLFRPVVIDQLGVVIAGGSSTLYVFQVYDRQRLWFAIQAQVQIAGFAFNEGALYVQDGPVLSCWSLATGACIASMNLVTQQRWAKAQGDLTDGVVAKLHELPPDLAAKQDALAQARQRLAWARLLEHAEATSHVLTAAHQQAGSVMAAELKDEPARVANMVGALRTMVGGAAPEAGAPDVLRAACASCARAQADAVAVVFSGPVVRQHQIRGKAGGMVFVLGSDGSVHSLDNGLTHVDVVKFDAPATPALALAEIPTSDPNTYLCRLFYLTADGGIRELDGSVEPPAALAAWPPHDPPDPSAQLPLSFNDGLLWGGGVLGADFFAVPPNPPSAGPIVSVLRPAGPWRDYEADPGEQLALVTDGTTTRLACYAAGAKTRDRWGALTMPVPAWMAFWTGTGNDAKPPQPRLVLAVDDEAPDAQSGAGFRVFVANTVDDPLQMTAFPPPPVIAWGMFDAGAFSGTLPRMAWVRAKPTVARQEVYMVVRSATPTEQVRALAARNDLQLLGQGTVPTLPGSDALVACSLTAVANAALPAAAAELQRLGDLVNRVAIRVMGGHYLCDAYGPIEGGTLSGLAPLAGWTLALALSSSPGSLVTATTDGNGVLRLDQKHYGATATVDASSLLSMGDSVTCSSCALQRGQVSTLTITACHYLGAGRPRPAQVTWARGGAMADAPPLTCVPSRLDVRDWVFEPEEQALADPPAAVDLREAPDGFPPVYDQGTLNSCTANALAAALYYDMRRQRLADAFHPSRLFIYYNERKDEGTIGLDPAHGRPVQMRDCIETAVDQGACPEEKWPYEPARLDLRPLDAAYAFALAHRVQSYHRIVQDLAHLKACLAQGFPFLFGMRVYASFPRYGTRGVDLVPLPGPNAGAIGGHALLAVGYDDARRVFIVRNSWGPDWGDGGHCHLPYDYLTDPNLAFDHWVVNAVLDGDATTAEETRR